MNVRKSLGLFRSEEIYNVGAHCVCPRARATCPYESQNRKHFPVQVLLLIIMLILGGSVNALTLPDDNFVNGWTKPVKPLVYNRESLSDYNDGDAEVFLELGFQQLQVQQYKNGNAEVDLEAYEFASPNGALGIYLMKCGKEAPAAVVGTRNTVSETQLLAVKGNCFIQVMNYTDGGKETAVMTKLAQQALANLSASDTTTALLQLPKAQMQPGSEHVFSGPLSLQAFYRLGKGDVLQLQSKIFGAAAKYTDSDRNTYTFVIVPYPDATSAQSAFANFQKNIDPGFQVFGKTPTGFAFKDRQAKYATVALKDNVIELQLNLVRKPGPASK